MGGLAGSIWFFVGFVANDSVLAGWVSAFVFTVLLGAFAVVPPILIALMAWRSFRSGPQTRRYVWTILLSFPWIILAWLCWAYTPLPKLISALALWIAILLCAWALISLILEHLGSRNR